MKEQRKAAVRGQEDANREDLPHSRGFAGRVALPARTVARAVILREGVGPRSRLIDSIVLPPGGEIPLGEANCRFREANVCLRAATIRPPGSDCLKRELDEQTVRRPAQPSASDLAAACRRQQAPARAASRAPARAARFARPGPLVGLGVRKAGARKMRAKETSDSLPLTHTTPNDQCNPSTLARWQYQQNKTHLAG